MKIYCPRCGFEPARDVLWACFPGCHHHWHTFDTRGQCPNCFKWWRVTQCPACQVWSNHDDWYHDTPPVEEAAEHQAEPAATPQGQSDVTASSRRVCEPRNGVRNVCV